MGEILGQQVVVENVGGAGGMTGSKRVADAAPDGYKIVLGTVGTHAQGQTLYKRPLYNPPTDFAPVGTDRRGADRPDRAQGPAGRTTSRSSSPTPRRTRRKMQFGSAGAGSATHLGCVLLNYVIGINITHVPYRGTGPAMQDLHGGRIDYLCEIVTTAKPQIDGGTVKALAIFAQAALAGAAEPADCGEQGRQQCSRPTPGTRCSCQGHARADRQEAERGRCRGDEDACGEGEAVERSAPRS